MGKSHRPYPDNVLESIFCYAASIYRSTPEARLDYTDINRNIVLSAVEDMKTHAKHQPERTHRIFLAKYKEGKTLAQIGESENVTCERIRQICAEGLWHVIHHFNVYYKSKTKETE